MQAANDALADQCAQDPTVADIEHLEDPEGQHIEMVRAPLQTRAPAEQLAADLDAASMVDADRVMTNIKSSRS